MGRIRYLLVLATVALPAPSAAAAAPQVYVANGSGYSVAFAEEAGKFSVLGLETQLYCSYPEAGEKQKPFSFSRVRAPAPMIAGPAGLTYRKHETEMSEKTYSADLSITANLTGGALLGQFSDVGVSQIEASRCQTGTYYDGDATVPFEAKRYFRPGEPGAGVPVAGEDPAYFSRNGPLELFIRSQAKKVVIRGALVSRCKFGGDHKSTRSPLFGVPYTLQLDGKRSFSREFKKNAGRVHGDVINEVTRISGTVGEAAIDGTYLRRSVTGEGVAARSCTLGPLHFHADRFLPPAG